MSGSDLVALFIGLGYLWAAGHLWHVRRAFGAVRSFGALIYPILVVWALFYLSLPWMDERHHIDWYVWLSRVGHIFTIFLVALVVRYGEAILEVTGRDDGHDH